MSMHFKNAAQDVTNGSAEGRLSFPQVLAILSAAGVERYHADLTRAERTFYLPNGESEVVSAHHVQTVPAQAFSAKDVEAALRTIQRGEIDYIEFCERIAAAGCVGYVVSLAGRRAVYSGRSSDTYVEHFPGSK